MNYSWRSEKLTLNVVAENEPPSNNLQTPPQATSAGTTGPILDLNLNKTNGDSGEYFSYFIMTN